MQAGLWIVSHHPVGFNRQQTLALVMPLRWIPALS
jgi:hypothetical protein